MLDTACQTYNSYKICSFYVKLPKKLFLIVYPKIGKGTELFICKKLYNKLINKILMLLFLANAAEVDCKRDRFESRRHVASLNTQGLENLAEIGEHV